MLEESKIVLSKHAIERYRERVNNKATELDIIAHIRTAKTPSKKDKKVIRSTCKNHKHLVKSDLIESKGFIYLTRIQPKGNNPICFVLKVLGAGSFKMITCFILDKSFEKK